MSHLRIVGAVEPMKPPRQKGSRTRLFSAEEERALRAALRTLQGVYGSWPCLAEVMGLSVTVVWRAAHGLRPVTAEAAIRASRAARRPLEELLSPVPRRVAS